MICENDAINMRQSSDDKPEVSMYNKEYTQHEKYINIPKNITSAEHFRIKREARMHDVHKEPMENRVFSIETAKRGRL